MEHEKTINAVIKEFRAAFGEIEFKVVQAGTGITVASKGWVEPAHPRLEISGMDYIALGRMNIAQPLPSRGVVSGIFKIMKVKDR